MNKLRAYLKHWFIPHAKNGHKPRLLRNGAAATLIVIALLAEGLLFAQDRDLLPDGGLLGEILSSVLVGQTNSNRTNSSLGTLRTNPLLEVAARAKAEDMAAKGYFAHTSPEGRTPWYWLDLVGYKYAYAGENLAVDFEDSTDVTNAWMNSPGHRANIMSERYTEIGIATARGTFEGHPTVFVVQFFGRPTVRASAPGIARVTPTPVPKPAAPKPTSTVLAAEATPATATSVVSTTAAAAPAPIVTTDVTGSSPVAAAMANPVRSINGLFILLMLLVGVALGAKLYRVGLMHPRLIVNGLVVIIVLGAFVALNGQAFLANARVF